MLQQKINYSHQKVKSGREWSGVLFVRELQGFSDTNTHCVIEALDFYFLNVGTSGFTELTTTGHIAHFYRSYGAQKAVEHNVKTGFIHSHHSMATHPSGTDEDEVVRLAPQYNYFVSLIVNCDGNYTCLIGQNVKTTHQGLTSRQVKNNSGQVFDIRTPVDTTSEQVIIGRATINYDHMYNLIDDEFKKSVTEALTRPLVTPVYNSYNDYRGYDSRVYNRAATQHVHQIGTVFTQPTVVSGDAMLDAFEDFLETEFGLPNAKTMVTLDNLLTSTVINLKYDPVVWANLIQYWMDEPDISLPYPAFIEHLVGLVNNEAALHTSSLAVTRTMNVIAALKQTLKTFETVGYEQSEI